MSKVETAAPDLLISDAKMAEIDPADIERPAADTPDIPPVVSQEMV